MPELRQDIVTGNWVVVSTERALRPTSFEKACTVPAKGEVKDCPFCPGHELMTPLEVLSIREPGSAADTPGWQVRVFPNKSPAFETCDEVGPSEPMFPRRAADGSHEVIIDTPDHWKNVATMDTEEVALLLRVYRHRYLSNAEDPHIRYVHIIVNHGREAGASLEHSHSQLFGVPIVPPIPQQEQAGASWYSSRHSSCVFCDMIEREVEKAERVIFANDGFVAISPWASKLPFEAWLLPKNHQESFGMITEDGIDEFATALHRLLGLYQQRFGDVPYNYYIHTSPCDGSEYPYYHWHLEMIPKLTLLGSFELGTGMIINVTTPEHAAKFLIGETEQGMADLH